MTHQECIDFLNKVSDFKSQGADWKEKAAAYWKYKNAKSFESTYYHIRKLVRGRAAERKEINKSLADNALRSCVEKVSTFQTILGITDIVTELKAIRMLMEKLLEKWS